MKRALSVFLLIAVIASSLPAAMIPMKEIREKEEWVTSPGRLAEISQSVPFGFRLYGESEIDGLRFLSSPASTLSSSADYLRHHLLNQSDEFLSENYDAISSIFDFDPGYPSGYSGEEAAAYIREYLQDGGRFDTEIGDGNQAKAVLNSLSSGVVEYPMHLLGSDLNMGLGLYGGKVSNGFGWNWNVDFFFDGTESLLTSLSTEGHDYGNEFGIAVGADFGYGAFVYEDVFAIGFSISPQLVFRSTIADSVFIQARMDNAPLTLFASNIYDFGAEIDLNLGMFYRLDDELSFTLDFRNAPSFQTYWYFGAEEIVSGFEFIHDDNLYFRPFDIAASILWDKGRYHLDVEFSNIYSQIIWQSHVKGYEIDPFSFFSVRFDYDISEDLGIYAKYESREAALGVEWGGFNAELSSKLDRLGFGFRIGYRF